MDSLDERFSRALHNTARSWRQALDRRMKDIGISQSAWMAIALAAKAKQPMSQIELANGLGIEGPSMVAMLDKLEKSGLLMRESSVTDRRIKLVVPTEEGAALYRQVKNKAAALRRELFRDIDKEQLHQATTFLERLQEILEVEV